MREDQCKESVPSKGEWGWLRRHQCSKKIWKDGYCKVHHPDSVKARQEQASKRWDEKLENSVEARLRKAESINAELVEACKQVLDIINPYSHIPAQYEANIILQNALRKAGMEV